MSTLKTWTEGHVLHVRLNRPERKNAFDEGLIAELSDAFLAIQRTDPFRVVCLSGEGSVFCAGGDLDWMRRAATWTRDENHADALALFRMLLAVWECPKPVVAAVRGFALGGGSGLAAACDRVIAEEGAQFGFTEVRLGIIPGTISPFVVEKIGLSAARDLFTSGRRFPASKALQVGLVTDLVPDGTLDAAVAAALNDYLLAAPQAMLQAKEMAFEIADDLLRKPLKTLGPKVAAKIASKRGDPEARAGFKAFFEKRPPPWCEP